MTKKCDCENIRDKVLLSIIENLEDISSVYINSKVCEGCKLFMSKILRMNETLKEISSILDNSLPEIDVTSEVIEKIKVINEKEIALRELLNKEFCNSNEAELIAYIEDELDDVNKHRVLCRLDSSPELQKVVENLKRMHQILEEIGKAVQIPDLDEDLLPKIMLRVSSFIQEGENNVTSKHEETMVLGRGITETKEVSSSPFISQQKVKKPDNVMSLDSKEVSNHQRVKKIKSRLTKTANRGSYSLRKVVQIFGIAASFLFVMVGIYFLFIREYPGNLIEQAQNSHSQLNNKTDGYKIIPSPVLEEDSRLFSSKDVDHNDFNSEKGFTAKPLHEWEEILKENALANAGKLMRMGIWASLTPEEARELLKKSGLSPMAILGAVQFLPPEEAKAILEAAIANNPEDAYLRFAMVNTLKNMKDIDYNELGAHLSAWTNSDPSNVLPYYMEADIYLRNGEVESALNCIKEAKNVQGYNSYAMLTAQAYKEALIAKGLNPELAQLLASASLGLRETESLEEIAKNLLEYGRYYEEIGDYTTALMIYEALRDLGVNVDLSSNLLQERLAGIKYAQEALYALIRIMTQTYSFSDIQSYIAFLQNLNQLLENYNNALASFYELFNTLDPQVILQILNAYLAEGNANASGYSYGTPSSSIR